MIHAATITTNQLPNLKELMSDVTTARLVTLHLITEACREAGVTHVRNTAIQLWEDLDDGGVEYTVYFEVAEAADV